MGLPYIDLKGADAFEGSVFLNHRWTDLGYLSAILLLKKKLSLDLSLLDRTTLVGDCVPQEVLDVIRAHAPGTMIVREDEALLEARNHGGLVYKLEKQVDDIIGRTSEANIQLSCIQETT
jgi:hypothetical protein